MLRTFLFLAAVAAAQETPPGDRPVPRDNPYQTQADIARGRQLYMGQCAGCHGPSGDGGKGANLARPTLPRAPDDRALYLVLRDGIQGTGMPGAWVLNDHERWQVVAYVRTLGTTPPAPVAGDAAHGRALFRGKAKCSGCHAVGAEGGTLGPALTEVGLRRSAAFLRGKLLDPASHTEEDYRFIQARTHSGREISGMRLNEDTFSIQVRDLAGNLQSLWKSDLADLKKSRTASPMPSYRGTLSASEVDDMLAYLLSLRGDR